ncbi:unnamed protein product, partial [Rhizoctonia solani]
DLSSFPDNAQRRCDTPTEHHSYQRVRMGPQRHLVDNLKPSGQLHSSAFPTRTNRVLNKNMQFSYTKGSVVDIIFVTANPAIHPPHPMHQHDCAVEAGYKGINLKNPPLRDGFLTPVAITG